MVSECSNLFWAGDWIPSFLCPYDFWLGGLAQFIIIGLLFGAIYISGRHFGTPGIIAVVLAGLVIPALPPLLQLPAYSLMAIAAGLALYRGYSNPSLRGGV